MCKEQGTCTLSTVERWFGRLNWPSHFFVGHLDEGPCLLEGNSIWNSRQKMVLWVVPLQGDRERHGTLGELRVGLPLWPMCQEGYRLWWQAVGFWSAATRLRTRTQFWLTLPMGRKPFLIPLGSVPSLEDSSRFWGKFPGLDLRRKHMLKTMLVIWGNLSPGQKWAWSLITQRICLEGVFLRVGLYVKEVKQIGNLKTISDTIR